MARLYRPYIPVAVRVQVAERQLLAREGMLIAHLQTRSAPAKGFARLDWLLAILFIGKKFALDHDPALINRRRYVRNGNTFYAPPANDPNHLTYREAGPGSDHDIKTRVRGDGAQLSDLAIARKRKNKERKVERPKHLWPKGRKIQNRGLRS